MIVTTKGGRHLRQAHDEQGAGAVLPACPLLQGGRQGQAGGPRPSGHAREARGRVGGVALGGGAPQEDRAGGPGRQALSEPGEAQVAHRSGRGKGVAGWRRGSSGATARARSTRTRGMARRWATGGAYTVY